MRLFRARLILVSAVLALLACGIAARLFVVQVVKGHEYAARSKSQVQERQVLKAGRGRILDCRGRVLASSSDRALTLNRGNVELAAADAGRGSRAGESTISRVYPYGTVGAAVLGYIGRDGYGLGGAELAFDRYLRGEDGWEIVQRDAARRNGSQRKYRTMDLPGKAPAAGADVYLTIDLDIQRTVESVLRQTLQQFRAKGAMCVVMEPATGRILAMADEPGFDPNFPGAYPLDQRRNRCLTQIWEPGSTFKIVTAAAALENNVRRESDIIDGNNGVFMIYSQCIRDHEPRGLITFADAMAYSSNVCFAKVANDLGSQQLYRYTRDFGFGSATGVSLPGEEAGIVHPVREWSGRTRVTMAIGQEISVTFIQVMQAFACVANNGVLVQPRIWDRVADSAGLTVDSTSLKSVRSVIRPETALRLRSMMRLVVQKGTGTKAAIDGITVAGKTGTSQKLNTRTKTYSDSLSCASFIGFAPAENPVLVCGVMVDEPANAEYGGTAAAPAFRQIITQIVSNPDLEYAQQMKAHDAMAVGAMKPAQQRSRTVAAKKTVVPAVQTAAAGNGIPDCRGRNLKDALNLLNRQGVTPYVFGSGTVKSQNPAGGSARRSAPACTLYCSFEG